jgi:hypothetical protein
MSLLAAGCCVLILCFVTHSVTAYDLPDFSWNVVPRFVHCGPDYKPDTPGKPPRLPLDEIYRKMSTFPLATLEKFTLQTAEPANTNAEEKILKAAKAIKSYNTRTKVIFYHMAWQNFGLFGLYNETLAHINESWTVTWDNGTVPGYDDWQCTHNPPKPCSPSYYNLSNPAMRAAWVSTQTNAYETGLIDGFFIDITPQIMPNHHDGSDPVDPTPNTSKGIVDMCKYCSPQRQKDLLNSLGLALAELADACPNAVIICNPTDYGACNTGFFEYFGSSADHGRSVLGDFYILQNKFKETGHTTEARAATDGPAVVLHLAEFLISAANYTYFGASHGWGCDDGWFDDPETYGEPKLWERPLGAPLGPMARVPNGGDGNGWIYTRSFAKGTHVWLNLTNGWKHARQCTRPNKTWPTIPICPQTCIWWGDGGNVTQWPPGFVCNKSLHW